MPKPALNNRNNKINVYGRVIQHDIFVNQGVSNNDSPTFASLYLTGDAIVSGNLYVEGNTAILNSNIIEFEDNIILINSKETGNGVTLNQAGFEVERGTLDNYRFAFRESDLNFRIGLVNNMQVVATREDSPLLNGIMTWNNTEKRLDSSNTINIPIITFQSSTNSLSSSTGSIILAGGIGIKKDVFIDGSIYLGGNSYNKKCSIYTNQVNNNLVISCGEEINLIPRTGITIPTNIPFIFGDSNKFIRSNLSNNLDITCDGDINLNLGFSKRLIIPNLSSIVFSTDNEKIFTDGFNNLVIQCSEDILLQPLTNKKILIPNDIPIAFSNNSQQIKSNANNDLLFLAGRNITLTPNGSVRINSTIQSNSITSGGIILTGGMGMSGNLNIGGTLSVVGDLNILGTTTTINTETLLIKDNLVILNSAPAALADSGILVKRFITGTSGSVNYAGLFYKESTDEYTFALTNSDSSITPLSITNYLPIRADSITLVSTSGNSIDTAGDVNIGKNLFITGPTLKIPVGDTISRPSNASTGSIRYNTEYSQFEGFGAGNAWGSLGGVSDIAQTTKILASASPGITDGNLYFYNIGVESMRINSTGNVGIGTSNPDAKLHISGSDVTENGGNAALTIQNTAVTSGNKWMFRATPTGDLTIADNNDYRIRVTSQGNVGIGTSNPGSKLHIKGTNVTSTICANGEDENATLYFGTPYLGNESSGLKTAIIAEGKTTYSRARLHFCLDNTADNSTAYNASTNNSKMMIDSNGNVGISTTSPNTFLVVGPNGGVNDFNDIPGISMKSVSGSSMAYSVGQSVTNNIFLTWYHNAIASNGYASLSTYGGNNNLILQRDGGNIGIGTSSPTTKLHVEGDIFSSGEITILSDIRYKTNIETIDNALDKVNKIRGVYFNRTKENGEIAQRNVGVIADEIEKVLPEVVYLQNDIKSVAYHNMIGLLIEAVKELKTEINELKTQIKESN